MSQSRFQLEALESRIMLAADAAFVEPLAEALSGDSTDMVIEVSLEETVDTFQGFEAGGLFEGFEEPNDAIPSAEQAVAELPLVKSEEEATSAESDGAATLEQTVSETLKEVELSAFQAAEDDVPPVVTEGDLNDFSTTLVSTLHAANAPPGQDGVNSINHSDQGSQGSSDLPTLQVIPDATVTWISDADGFWDEGSNWSTGTVPTITDSVLIDRGNVDVTVTIRETTTVAYLISDESLAITGGRFTVSTEGELNGETELSGGTLAGAANLNRGTISTIGSGIKFMAGTLNNAGTIIHSEGTLALNSGVINNLSGGLFEFAGDSSLRWWSGTRDFNNSGTVRKSAGTGISNMTGGGSGIAFNNAADGVIDVQTGTLVLNGIGSSQGGTFTVADGAVLDLTGGSASNIMGGTYVGTGDGEILLQSGRINLEEDTVFNFANGLFHWTGGSLIGGSLTNTGLITLEGSGIKFLSTILNNTSTIVHTEGTLAFNGGVFNNLSGALFDFAGDSNLRWWSGTHDFNNSGTVRKSQGTGTSNMTGGGSGVTFNNAAEGTIEVQTGTLMLNGSGTHEGGNYIVSTDAILDLTGGSTSNILTGTYVGSGGGTVLLQNGRVFLGENTVFDFPSGMFLWTGGSLSSGSLTNANFITLDGAGIKFLSTVLNNSGSILHKDGTLAFSTGVINNQSDGLFEFAGDSDLRWWSGTHDFNNSGIVRKSQGTGISNMTSGGSGITFNNAAEGVIEVQTGTLMLNGSGTSAGGNFMISPDAVLDLTGGSSSNTLAGTYVGSGGGSILIPSGSLNLGDNTVFDFAPDMLQWTGGTLNGDLLNVGDLTIAGSVIHFLSGTLTNAGMIRQTDDSVLALTSGTINNQSGAVYDFVGDGSLRWWSGPQGQFNNTGTFRKSEGIGITDMKGSGSQIAFNNAANGVIEVQSGTVLLNGNGISSGGTFLVDGNAKLEFNGNQTLTGTYTGSGFGKVVLSGATITGDETTQFNFPSGFFEWVGGTLSGTFANTGSMSIAGNGLYFLSGTLNNSGTINHEDTAIIAFSQGVLNNESDGVYDIKGDGAFRWWNGSQGLINNAGLLSKTGGLGESNFTGGGSPTILNNTGTVEVSSGTLNVNGPNSQIDSSKLTAGTWIADDGILNLNANITTNDGSLVLAGSSGNIAGISNLTTNNGSFTIGDGAAFNSVGAFTNQGILALDAAGDMTITGDFIQGADATLKFALGGPPNGGNFGVLTITGDATLGGTMETILADGYGPQTGDSFTVATYNSRTGTFAEEAGLAPFFTSDLAPTSLVFNTIGTASDLSVSQVSGPVALGPGDSATIDFTVTNLSGRDTSASWTDSVYLSTDTLWDPSDVLVGSDTNPNDLVIGASYNGSVDVTIPTVPNNQYFLLVVADSDGMVPDSDRTNNDSTNASSIEISTTRVRVTATEPTGTIKRPISFFDLTFNQTINDATFTTDDVLITGPDGGIDATLVSPLGNNTYRVSFDVQNSNGIYTLSVGPNIATHEGSLLDQDDDGAPGEALEDVFTVSTSVALPDLTPTNLDLPNTPVSQASNIILSWFVYNQGSAAAVADWTENVIASTDDILGNGDDIVLGSTNVTSTLSQRNSRSFFRGTNVAVRQLEVVIPRTMMGVYNLYVQVDSGDAVVESDETNQTVSGVLTVVPIPPEIDLVVSSIGAPEQSSAGSTIDVSWTVTNSGTSTTIGQVLVDGIYLSADDTLDANDTLLDYHIRRDSLESDASYAEARSVMLPSDLSLSTFRILVVADVINLFFEKNAEANNTLASTPITLVSQSNAATTTTTLAQFTRESFNHTISPPPSDRPNLVALFDTESDYAISPFEHEDDFHFTPSRGRSWNWENDQAYWTKSELNLYPVSIEELLTMYRKAVASLRHT